MSTYTSKAEVDLIVNGKAAEEELKKLRETAEELRKKIADLTEESAKNGKDMSKDINEARKEYNKTINDIKSLQKNMQNIGDSMARIDKLTPKELQKTIRAINAELNSGRYERGSESWNQLTASLRRAKEEMSKLNEEMKETRSLSDKFSEWGNKWMGIAMTIDGAVQGLSGIKTTMRDAVQAYADMQEAQSQVIKYTGMTAEETDALNEAFKKMDTRTPRTRLNELAGDAGKLGITSQEAVLEFVDAADKINVALGEDLGEDAVKNIGKLAQMFGEDKKKGLRGAMLATGSAINEVAQNSSAAEAYLVEFTARVAGAAKQANISQANIIGYASVLDENMLRDETAATAFQNIMIKMFQKPELFAKIARINTKEFTDTMKEDANKAMLQFIESLSDRGNLANLAPLFDEMKLDGQGAASVLAVMAGKINDIKERQLLANDAYRDATSIINEFNVQNNTVQAQLDKAKNKFNDLRVELGEKLLPVMRSGISLTSTGIQILINIIEFVQQHKVAIIAATSAIAFYTAAVNASVIADKLKVFWTGKVVNGLKILKSTLAKNPLGILLVVVSTIIGLLYEWYTRQNEVIDSSKKMLDLSKRISDEINTERSKIETLTAILNDNNVSLNKRKEALSELKKIAPGYNAELTNEGKLIKDNKEVLDEYLANLEKEIRLKNIKAELEQVITDKQAKEKEIETFEQDADAARKMMRDADSHTFSNMFLFWTDSSKAYHKAADIDKNYKKIKAQLEAEKKDLENYQAELMKEYGVYSNTVVDNTVVTKNGKGKTGKTGGGGGSGLDDEANEIRRLRINAINQASAKQRLQAKLQYSAGIIDYQQYQKQLYDIDVDNIQQRLALYKSHESEYGSIQNELTKRDEDLQKEKNSWSMAFIQKETDEQINELKIRHLSGLTSEQEYQDELDRIELEGLKRRAQYIRQWGSPDEANKAEEAYEQATNDKKMARQTKFLQQIKDLQDKYLKSSAEEQMKYQLNMLEQMHNEGLIKEEEYQRLLAMIRMSGGQAVKTEADQKTSKILADAGYVAPQGSSGSMDALSSAVIGLGKFAATQKQNEAALQKIKEMEQAGVITHQEAARAAEEIDKNRFNNFVAGAQAAYAMVNSLTSAASNFVQASMDAEIAKVEQRYQTEIDRAGDNADKTAKLEAEKEAEVAKIKNQYNKKAMAIEIAQAIASTAMSAINAYSSAAQVPLIGYIMAPVAAAAALAAGAIQIATIKKQHEAQSNGYYTGGFTGSGPKKQVAGTVHAGEFVVNADAVNNPNIMPLLHFIDQAQRNNTVGSLTAEDVSRVVTAPVVSGTASMDTARTTVQIANDSHTKRVLERLDQRLSEPIRASVVIDGEDGFDRQYTRYKKLINRR